ncbi:HlyD family secretion protein [Vibrio alginolyticus]|uniref:HlyD family secretion protein n=1 Tax=Vibrio alginolyticus TaxID=663 RepID=UPI000362E4E8|nr:HlyD family secretion protein [Vibrio alginolyticus]EGQ7842183.1 HlyD family secretion protein [Vibrio alginolyticus]EGQ7845650.1 HlyD family secretion protein [Vibrio alginolyticus]EGQ8983699.1 HlyD family efflux transporter periplasmic adaptor subunit [Vibrio alginolyticus]EGR0304504.1 HlyD family secretion protein [Vibrio alginolyticus]EHK5083953.1 HlyD family secretion protein [Vibrio alginolyticus]
MSDDIAKHSSSRSKLVKTLFFTLCVIAFSAMYWSWQYSDSHPSTEDAYVRAKILSVAPQVKGQVVSVDVKDFQSVNKGDLLLKIDSRPYLLAVKQAKAAYQLAVQQHDVADKQVTEAVAGLDAARSNLTEAQVEYKRTDSLVKRKLASDQDLDTAKNKLANAQASLEQARATVEKAIANRGEEGAEAAVVQQAAAQLAQAELNLSYTDITSPVDGIAGEINTHVGSVVSVGQTLFPVILKDSYWVRANFKETDLTHIKPGMHADVVIDMYPDVVWKATVEQLSPASGTSFSLMPPENATGNWVKIKQRFPVRLALEVPADAPQLRVGASSEVTIDLQSSVQ